MPKAPRSHQQSLASTLPHFVVMDEVTVLHLGTEGTADKYICQRCGGEFIVESSLKLKSGHTAGCVHCFKVSRVP